MTIDPSEPHAYTVTFRSGRYLLAAGLAALGLLLASGWSLQAPPRPASSNAVLVGLILLAASVYAVLSTALTRLSLTEQGLEYRNAGSTIRARWDEVRKISRRHGRYGDRIVVVVATSSRVISLSQFGGQWRTGPLGQDLQRYAPRLFDDNPALR